MGKQEAETALQSGRNSHIDVMRGLAILFVVVGHLIETWYPAVMIPKQPFAREFIYSFHMPFFYAISGYCGYWSVRKYPFGGYLRRKVITLLVPCVSWTLLAVAQHTLLHMGEYPSIGRAIGHYLYLCFVEKPSMWYLVNMFVMALALYVAVKLSARLGWWMYLVVYVVLLLLPNEFFWFRVLEKFYPFFLLGYCCNHNRDSWTQRLRRPAVHAVVLLLYAGLTVLAWAFALTPLHSDLSWMGVRQAFEAGHLLFGTVWAFVGCIFWYIVSVHYIARVKVLVTVLSQWGQLSLDIYGMHPAFVRFLTVIPPFLVTHSLLFSLVYAPLYGIVIVAVIGLLARYVLRRIPLYNFLFAGLGLPRKRDSQ